MSFINEFFSAVTAGIEGSKNEVRGKTQRSSPGGASAGSNQKEDLTASQINEVSELIQGGMNGLAQVVGTKLQQQNERIAALEQKTEAHEHDVKSKQAELEHRLAAVEQRPPAPPDSHMQAQIAELRTQMEKTRVQAPAAPASQPPVQRPPGIDLPWEMRTHAVLGNLRYDDSRETVQARAKEVLTEAGFTEGADYKGLSATRQSGSMVELFFSSPSHLLRAKVAIRLLQKQFRSAEKAVWCDAKKTRAEMRPARIVHRIHDCLSEVEKKKPSDARIEKDVAKKEVLRNDVTIGRMTWGKWRWTPEGQESFNEDQLKTAFDWALQE